MDAGSEAVGDLRCPERGFSAPSNQTAPSGQAAGAPGDAFRALPVNGGGSVAVANAADAADTVALVEHGMCGGFSWLCTAAGQAFRNALGRHGAKAGFAGAAWRWLLLGTDADRPPDLDRSSESDEGQRRARARATARRLSAGPRRGRRESATC